MSFTITVPDDVPLLFHNSKPFCPLVALKKSVLPTAVNRSGNESASGCVGNILDHPCGSVTVVGSRFEPLPEPLAALESYWKVISSIASPMIRSAPSTLGVRGLEVPDIRRLAVVEESQMLELRSQNHQSPSPMNHH